MPVYLLTVAAIWAIAAVTPGPNFLVVVRSSFAGGRVAALACVAGTILGTAAWSVAGWLGLASLFAAAPGAYVALKVVGGLYILFLGVRLIVSVLRGEGEMARTPAHGSLSPGRAFRLGLATNLANPKTAVFVASVFAAALPAPILAGQALPAIALMLAISTGWYCLLASALSTPRIAGAYRRARRVIDGFAGTVFAAFGAKFILSARAL